MRRWSGPEWRAQAARHRERLAPLIEPHLERRARGVRHPVFDFLFEYYAFPPIRLMDWHPGWEDVLEEAASYRGLEGYTEREGGVGLDLEQFPVSRQTGLRWVCDLLAAVEERPARFGCFGLHEWAMVYRSPGVRHPALPMRMKPDELAMVVESSELCCSHFDAFRFFTPDAVPRNRLPLTRKTQHAHEQPGCLHANMDLYKWCFKFHPWVGSDLMADAFLLAVRIRTLDMEASPYDVQGLGYGVVPIETAEGRAEYVRQQRAFAAEAAALRTRLRATLDGLRDRLSLPKSFEK